MHHLTGSERWDGAEVPHNNNDPVHSPDRSGEHGVPQGSALAPLAGNVRYGRFSAAHQLPPAAHHPDQTPPLSALQEVLFPGTRDSSLFDFIKFETGMVGLVCNIIHLKLKSLVGSPRGRILNEQQATRYHQSGFLEATVLRKM